jgi:hypothetical protein
MLDQTLIDQYYPHISSLNDFLANVVRCSNLGYSVLRAIAGSIEVARRAGIIAAASVAVISTPPAAARTDGSSMWRIDQRARTELSATPSARPEPRPTPTATAADSSAERY